MIFHDKNRRAVSATNELLVNSVMCCMSSRHGLNVDALHCSGRGGEGDHLAGRTMSLMRGAHAALRGVSLMSGPAILGTFPMHDSDGCAVLS